MRFRAALASSAHLRCTSRGQLKRATPHASSTLTDSEAQVRFQYLTPHATANIRLSLGTEDQLHLGVKDEPHTNARPQTRAKQYTMDGFTKPRLMLQILHHKLQQRSSHDFPPGTKKKTQSARPKTHNTARKLRFANCECKRFIDTVARRNDDNPVFRQDEDLRLSGAYL